MRGGGRRAGSSYPSARAASASAGGAAGRELALLKRLGPLLGRAAASAAIADTLVPVLSVRKLDESAIAEVLHALAAVVPPAPRLSAEKNSSTSDKKTSGRDDEETRFDAAAAAAANRHRAALAPLFGRLRTRTARRALVAAFTSVAARDVAASVAAPILRNLHADAKNAVDGADYDARLGAYETLDARWFSSCPPAAVVPILHHMLHELRGSDMALRHAASAALERFLDAAVEEEEEARRKVTGKDGSGSDGDESDDDESDDDESDDDDAIVGLDATAARALKHAAASEASLGAAVIGVLAPGVRGLLRSPDKVTRGEAVGVFRRLAIAWPTAAPGAAKLADDDDPEKDFFLNMAHLQAHRRCKALRALSSRAGSVPPDTVVGYFAPLAVASLGDAGADVASTAAAAIGGLAGALPWRGYRDLLTWTLRKAGGGRAARGGWDVEGSKALHIRAAATTLENFHEWDDDDDEEEKEEEGGERERARADGHAKEEASNVVGRRVSRVVVETLRMVRSIHWSPYDRVRVVNADP
jgi:U3 small nucleolar RNA-associated protein 20